MECGIWRVLLSKYKEIKNQYFNRLSNENVEKETHETGNNLKFQFYYIQGKMKSDCKFSFEISIKNIKKIKCLKNDRKFC